MNSSHQQEKRYTPTCILSVVCIYYGIQNHLHYGFNTNMSTVPSISTTPAHSYKTRTSPAGRPGSWTGPGLSKDRPGQRPSRSTRDPGKTQARPIFFFFQIWDLKLISIYSMFLQKKLCFFNVRFETH